MATDGKKIVSRVFPLVLCGLSGCYYPVYTPYPAYPNGYPPATQTYVAPGGQECREYTKEVIINGQKQQAVGSACRQQNGSWKDGNGGQMLNAPPSAPVAMPGAPPPQPPMYNYNYPYYGYYTVPQR